MAVDLDLIRAYEDGAVYTHAPGATVTLPTTAGDPVPVGFFEIGAVGPDGLEDATSQNLNNYYIWQKSALGRQTRTESAKTFTFAAAETSIENLKLQYSRGSIVTSTAEGAAVSEAPPTADRRAWILHGIDGDREQRAVVPIGEIGERGNVVWSGAGPTVYEWTLNCYLDSSGFWVYRYFIDDDMATP